MYNIYSLFLISHIIVYIFLLKNLLKKILITLKSKNIVLSEIYTGLKLALPGMIHFAVEWPKNIRNFP